MDAANETPIRTKTRYKKQIGGLAFVLDFTQAVLSVILPHCCRDMMNKAPTDQVSFSANPYTSTHRSAIPVVKNPAATERWKLTNIQRGSDERLSHRIPNA
jgi:hypothetical protein